MKKFNFIIVFKFLPLFLAIYLIGCASSKQTRNEAVNNNSINLDTVKAGKFDTGKMWTFDYPPIDYFKSEYNFRPTEDWLNNVRMSALRFANYCSASFVSANGLVMTNHHCGRMSVSEVTKPGEDLYDNGFYAKTLQDERPVPGLFVDQLVLIKDVTKEIQSALDLGNTPKEKVENEKRIEENLKDTYNKKTGLRIQIVTLYNGGKYSLYGYKRYTDVRLVFSPEASIGFFGGDYDNFTYPRYDLDCNFFRVYENGKPLNTEHYFKWSPAGAEPGEPVFIVGNPGHTDRLKTISQLEYMRDILYPRNLNLMNSMVNVYTKLIKDHPDKKSKYENTLFMFSNSQKAISGELTGLLNPYLMQRKIVFENKFKEAVKANPNLNNKYGNLWDKIAGEVKQLEKISNQDFALTIYPRTSSQYFLTAEKVIDLANQLRLPENLRDSLYKGSALDSTMAALIPKEHDADLDREILKTQIDRFYLYLGDDPVVERVTGGYKDYTAADYMINNSILLDSVKLNSLIRQGADAILNSSDPFVYFIVHTDKRRIDLQNKIDKIVSTEDTFSQELGKALFEVYGTSIPPDATFTLRISDGVVKGFPYNGTIAPPYTTFYGLYNRYYSFGEKSPWSLPKEWLNPPADFIMSTQMNFVSTNDIIGGNSGSPVINEKGQIVGLAFDGNIQSLPGDFIYTSEENRAVSVHSAGMMEAIKDIYKATRLANELKFGKIIDTTSNSGIENKGKGNKNNFIHNSN
jgi:hypothetical protein